MSYLVFARKWRPQSFEEVLSQDHVTITLKNAINTDRIGHAYLLTGPRGVGKTTTARILAKALNCEKGPTSTPCQHCDSCRSITTGNHMDVREIDGASNRGIDQIRDLREKARYATASGKYKIYIIDEVHMLTNEAFNALLRILEEPPDSVVFIFATTQPRKVPDTILSRCQRFDFRRIPVSDMSEYLKKEAASEGITLDNTALSLVCRASGGSLRDALSLMDQLVSFSGNDIKGEEVSKLFGLVKTELLADITSSILNGNTSVSIDHVSGALAEGYSVDELLDALLVFLRNLLLVTTGAQNSLSDIPESESRLLLKLAEDLPDIAVLNILRILSSAALEVKRSNLPRVTLETAVMTASKLSLVFSLKDLPPVTDRIVESCIQTKHETSLEKEIIDTEPDSTQEEQELPSAEAVEKSGRTEVTASSAEDDSADDENDEEKEKETSREILGLFDAV
ncbi:MAG: DNA polymerase III subunit gamma/tau [Candidatus Aegiribacteria sp.]|nr:DNA polymerase III subunit gamma/tau [Candidatus Aegiribacteria sp.]